MTIVATSVTNSAQSVSASITITAVPPVILSDGTYVYHLSGQDGNGPSFVAGAFTVKGGLITGGEQDFTDPAYGRADQLIAANCSLSSAGGNIQIVLATSDPVVGVNGVETLRGSVVSNSRVLLSEFDTSTAATGSLDLQTGAGTTPTGGYAFVLNGWDNGTPENQLVVGGILNFNGTNLSVSNSVFDYNDGGSVGQAQTFASGSITAPDAYGRVTVSLTPSAESNFPSFVLTGYIAGNKLQLIEAQSDVLNADLGGVALSQGSNAGKFTQASVVGASYAYGNSGEDGVGPVNIAGGFAFNSNGSVSGAMAYNDLANQPGTFGNQISGGTYIVDPTGRVTLTGVLPQPLNQLMNFEVYLDGNGNALVIGVDENEATAGISFQQVASSPDYEGSYSVAAQGQLNAAGLPYWGAAGAVTISSDQVNGFTDYTVQGYVPSAGVPLTGTENSSTGLLSLAGLNAVNFQTPTGFGYYPIDANRVIAISVSRQQLGVLWLEGTGVSH